MSSLYSNRGVRSTLARYCISDSIRICLRPVRKCDCPTFLQRALRPIVRVARAYRLRNLLGDGEGIPDSVILLQERVLIFLGFCARIRGVGDFIMGAYDTPSLSLLAGCLQPAQLRI
jgi:hypothetical protein